MSYSLVQNVGGPPSNAICYGCQNDGAGLLWSAVAHTDHGPIAGKANRSTCWYSHGGAEHIAHNFSWLTAPEGRVVPVKNKGFPPPGAVNVGRQHDQQEDCYAAIAICDQGLIPGKAMGSTCWYAYGGGEHLTNDFMWLVCL